MTPFSDGGMSYSSQNTPRRAPAVVSFVTCATLSAVCSWCSGSSVGIVISRSEMAGAFPVRDGIDSANRARAARR